MVGHVLCPVVRLLQENGAHFCSGGSGFACHQRSSGSPRLYQVSGGGEGVQGENIPYLVKFLISIPKFLQVRGYPTIMFIKGNMEFTYNGDRGRDELVDYALRMSGPPVQLVTRTESVDMLKGSHTIFFIFVGQQEGVVWDTYYAAAEGYQEHGFSMPPARISLPNTLTLRNCQR